jgi:phosphoribosylformylglycinamidine (FGAM) synthase-like amidotransferase family enzyme
MVFFRMCFCGPFCGPFCATESTEKVFSVHKNTFSVLSVAQNCADTKTEGTSEKVFGCGAHSFDVLMAGARCAGHIFSRGLFPGQVARSSRRGVPVLGVCMGLQELEI